MTNVENFLQLNNIDYVLHEHPAVFTCEEAEKYCGDLPGLSCKNLFLKDRKANRFFLLILPASKKGNLKEFAKKVGEQKVSFAKPEELKEKMGLTPGAVSPFGLLNDTEGTIEVYIDKEVSDSKIVTFHPNRNTASIELSNQMFHKFLQNIKNKINTI